MIKLQHHELPLIDQQFKGKYTNISLVGQGSFSKVFRCLDQDNKYVAIKVVKLQYQPLEVVEYMKNELVLMQQASECENVIKMLDFAETKDNIFIVLEFCQFNLDEVRQKFFDSKIPEDIAIQIFRQVVNGLCYLHKNRIIHRDLKLENIGVVMPNVDLSKITTNHFRFATYKLIDFGLSKCLTVNDQTSTFIGTPATMAPEVLNNDLYSFQADVYSLGCCLYRMITGTYPYFEKTVPLLLESINSEIAQFNLIQNEELRNVIQRMLKPNPNQRIDWEQLYQTSYFKQSIQQSFLNIQLEQNSKFYLKNRHQGEQPKDSSELKNRQSIISDSKLQPHGNKEFQDNNCFQIQLRKMLNYMTIRDLTLKTISLILEIQKDIKLFPQINYVSLKKKYEYYANYLLDFAKIISNYIEAFIQANNTQHIITLKQNVWLSDNNQIKQIEKFASQYYLGTISLLFQKKTVKNELQKNQQLDQELLNNYQQQNINIFGSTRNILSNCFKKYDQASEILTGDRLNPIQEVIAKLYKILINLAQARGIAELKPPYQNIDTKYIEIALSKEKNSIGFLNSTLELLDEIYNLQYAKE